MERFWDKVRKSDGCWIFSGNPAHRYGAITVNYERIAAHRYSYQLHRGPIPEGLCVCHSCDNTRCVNPEHLFLGTHADNMADKKRKRRGTYHTKEAHPNAKLNADQVAQMRELYANGVTQAELSRRFGTHQSNVSLIIKRETWK